MLNFNFALKVINQTRHMTITKDNNIAEFETNHVVNTDR